MKEKQKTDELRYNQIIYDERIDHEEYANFTHNQLDQIQTACKENSFNRIQFI